MNSTSPPARGPRRRRSTGPYAAADARRTAIVEAAITHFAQSGYLNSPLAQIAADAGTSATVVVHHFGSKAGLLMAVLAVREERTEARFIDAMRESGEVSALAMMRFMADLAEHNLREPGLVQMFTKLAAEAGDPEHPAHDHFARRYERLTGGIVEILEHAVARGELRQGLDVVAVARELVAVPDGLQVQWCISQRGFDLAEAVRSALDRLARSLTADGSGL